MKKSNNKSVAPVLQWYGGKRRLLGTLTPLLPQRITTYCEPFVGGGALLFALQPNIAYVNDINSDLIRVYNVIKSDVESLIAALQDYKNEADFFYAVRAWDRDKEKYSSLSDVQKAARILYLNKTCYGGKLSVNKAGELNATFSNRFNRTFVNAPALRAVSSYLNTATVHLSSTDFAEVLRILPRGTFVYLDPPYDPGSATSNFIRYSKDGFTRDDQIRLRECCDELTARGVKFMLSNSSTDFIRDQYAAYHILTVKVKRPLNCSEVDEVVVRNYK